MGLPALTLPTKTNFCGFMLMGKPFGENKLLSIGKSIETILRNES
jgi:Asp-tRNA(Asn)/Glu-tRNA(Gln) amidotransferase A subunit family amidase